MLCLYVIWSAILAAYSNAVMSYRPEILTWTVPGWMVGDPTITSPNASSQVASCARFKIEVGVDASTPRKIVVKRNTVLINHELK